MPGLGCVLLLVLISLGWRLDVDNLLIATNKQTYNKEYDAKEKPYKSKEARDKGTADCNTRSLGS